MKSKGEETTAKDVKSPKDNVKNSDIHVTTSTSDSIASILKSLEDIQGLAIQLYGSKDQLEYDINAHNGVSGKYRSDKNKGSLTEKSKENEDPVTFVDVVDREPEGKAKSHNKENQDGDDDKNEKENEELSDDSITLEEIGTLLPLGSNDKTKIFQNIDELVERNERIRLRRRERQQNMQEKYTKTIKLKSVNSNDHRSKHNSNRSKAKHTFRIIK